MRKMLEERTVVRASAIRLAVEGSTPMQMPFWEAGLMWGSLNATMYIMMSLQARFCDRPSRMMVHLQMVVDPTQPAIFIPRYM
jgi:hypothetical protein